MIKQLIPLLIKFFLMCRRVFASNDNYKKAAAFLKQDQICKNLTHTSFGLLLRNTHKKSIKLSLCVCLVETTKYMNAQAKLKLDLTSRGGVKYLVFVYI